MATLQTLPPELRQQIYTTYLLPYDTSTRTDPHPHPHPHPLTDQICATLDCFCGHRHRAFASQLLPLLLCSRNMYADVVSLLLASGAGVARRKRTLAFCSPACAVAVIQKLGPLVMLLVGKVEVHASGVWGVPVEAVLEVRAGVLRVLGEMEREWKVGLGREREEERDGEGGDRGTMGHVDGPGQRDEEEDEKGLPLWECRFQAGGALDSGASQRWMLVFSRVPQTQSRAATECSA